MNVILYFGSFNPIHRGHLGLAEFVLANSDADELWFVVSPHNPLKQKSDLWDDNRRLALIQDAISGHKGLRVSDIEFSLPQPNYTINTLRTLRNKFPEHSFSLLIGEDNYAIFNRWRDYDEILRDFRIFVYPRPGVNADRSLFPEMLWLDNAPLFDISSTEVRNRLANGESVSDLVP